MHEYVGGYTDWVRRRPAPSPAADAPDRPRPTPKSAPAASGPRRLTFKEQREQELLRKELETLPAKLAALEAEQTALEQKLADPEFFGRDPEGFNAAAARLPDVETEQLALLERWETVEARLTELKG